MSKTEKNRMSYLVAFISSLIKAVMCPDWLRDATGLPTVLEIIDVFLSWISWKEELSWKVIPFTLHVLNFLKIFLPNILENVVFIQ